jgi:hypothetical protein
MASILTLDGAHQRELGADDCKCVYNRRTRRYAKLCFVGKSRKSRTGWKFVGLCRR